MEPNKIKEIISEPKNQSNIDLMECMDFLSNEHEQLKDTILKLTYHLDEVEFLPLFEEFKLSKENNNIVGDLETKKRILKNKLYCFIMERLSKTYKISNTFPIRDNIDKYVDNSIYEDDFNDKEGKYKKKYLKYKNKYLNLKNKY